jgi:putative toxin-antitoxin system antitoxin component (TIGR02293 family)
MATYKNKKTGQKHKPAHLLEEPLGVYVTKAPDVNPGYVTRSLELLGLPQNKTFTIHNSLDFVTIIRNGVPKKALDTLLDKTGITTSEISEIIHTSDRTLRRYTPQQKLNPDQTERVIQLAHLYSRGEEVFEGLTEFKEWMNSAVIALGNKKPKEFLDTSIGIDYLIEELGRIEHGIFA